MHKILVIDNDVLFLETLVDLLEVYNFKVVGVPESWAGLLMAQYESFDLILCDLKMPKLNGYEVLISLRQNPTTATIPVIFIVAEQLDSDRAYAMALGVDDYLTKPFTTEELLPAIHTQLKKKTNTNSLF